MKILLLVGGLLLQAGLLSAASVTFVYTDGANYGFNDPTLGAERRAALEYTAKYWAARINSSVPIKVSSSFANLGGGPSSATLAQAGSPFLYEDGGIGYPDALADAIAGSDQGPANADILVTVNDRIDLGTVLGGMTFYYGLDQETPSGKIGFVRVVLHELAHGLGFSSVMASNGAYPILPPATPLPSKFDTFIVQGNVSQTPLVGMTQGDRATAATSGDLFFNGAITIGANGSQLPPLYAPSPFQTGSSVSHFDLGAFSPPELMEPSLAGSSFGVGLTDSTLEDLGYSVNYLPAASITSPIASTVNIPEGSSAMITIGFDAPAGIAGEIDYAIMTISGSPAEGVDFTVTPAGPIIFAAGTSTINLTVTATADGVEDLNESFEIRLYAPIGVEFGTVLSKTIVLEDVLVTGTHGWLFYQ